MNEILIGLLIVVSVLAVILLLLPFLKKQLKEEIRASQEQFLQLARQQFESDQSKATLELETRKQAVESSVAGLKEQLDKYQQLIREFEEDRNKKYGSLSNELKNASETTSKLQDETTRLNNILGNVKLRGQWGERIAEDIIRYAGLIEGVNYQKQRQLDASKTRPDYTFLLPNNQKVNMDVKFSANNYMNMVNTADAEEKKRFTKDFITDVKNRIKELKTREYINPKENTLDFVMLFIPNEQIFGFIQEKSPGVMDEALKEKVVICSPFTLYAMLSVIRQAHENFRFEKDLKVIINHIRLFSQHFDRFKKRFEDIGDSIAKLDSKYHDVKNKDFKNLDTKIRHIDEYKNGSAIAMKDDDSLIDVVPKSIEDDVSIR